eukprot:comp22117_c0_seq1/m.51542 comp22117_c0_seq1/g.51542  ORF comp22117_c0_seq1/g.51542 comp22117_c0_seq1/m.51542 type:complete len:302 (-) comp22117_c0_seq1:995-1900(-)
MCCPTKVLQPSTSPFLLAISRAGFSSSIMRVTNATNSYTRPAWFLVLTSTIAGNSNSTVVPVLSAALAPAPAELPATSDVPELANVRRTTAFVLPSAAGGVTTSIPWISEIGIRVVSAIASPFEICSTWPALTNSQPCVAGTVVQFSTPGNRAIRSSSGSSCARLRDESQNSSTGWRTCLSSLAKRENVGQSIPAAAEAPVLPARAVPMIASTTASACDSWQIDGRLPKSLMKLARGITSVFCDSSAKQYRGSVKMTSGSLESARLATNSISDSLLPNDRWNSVFISATVVFILAQISSIV